MTDTHLRNGSDRNAIAEPNESIGFGFQRFSHLHRRKHLRIECVVDAAGYHWMDRLGPDCFSKFCWLYRVCEFRTNDDHGTVVWCSDRQGKGQTSRKGDAIIVVRHCNGILPVLPV